MYKSEIERFLAEQLNSVNVYFEYEPVTFVISEKQGSKNFYYIEKRGGVFSKNKSIRELTYTPDFILRKHKYIIELKGSIYQQRDFPIRMKLFLKSLKGTEYEDFTFVVIKTKAGVKNFIKNILFKDDRKKVKRRKG